MPACAWCHRAIDETPTTLHGVAYHWACLARRMTVVRPFRPMR